MVGNLECRYKTKKSQDHRDYSLVHKELDSYSGDEGRERMKFDYEVLSHRRRETASAPPLPSQLYHVIESPARSGRDSYIRLLRMWPHRGETYDQSLQIL